MDSVLSDEIRIRVSRREIDNKSKRKRLGDGGNAAKALGAQVFVGERAWRSHRRRRLLVKNRMLTLFFERELVNLKLEEGV